MFIRWRRFLAAAAGVGSLAASALAGGGQTANVFAASCIAGTTTSGGHTTVTFCFTGAPQSWTVPPGVTGITVIADGAQGGAGGVFPGGGYPPAVPGANGNQYEVSLVTTPGSTYTIEVGGTGSGGDNVNGTGGAHGYNSGTDGAPGQSFGLIAGLGGGGGGGATALWNSSGSVLYVSAGGGGGGGGYGFALPAPYTSADGMNGGGGGGGGGYDASGLANGATGAQGTNASDGSDGTAGTDYCNDSVSTCATSPLPAVWAGDGQLTITYPPLTALPGKTPTPPQIPDIIVTLPTTTPTTTPTPPPTQSCGATSTITLGGIWTLVAWPGASTPVDAALAGGADHCGTNVTSQVAVVWGFDASTQTYHAFFPTAANVPGANDLASLTQGLGYWVALNDSSANVTWTVEAA